MITERNQKGIKLFLHMVFDTPKRIFLFYCHLASIEMQHPGGFLQDQTN